MLEMLHKKPQKIDFYQPNACFIDSIYLHYMFPNPQLYFCLKVMLYRHCQKYSQAVLANKLLDA